MSRDRDDFLPLEEVRRRATITPRQARPHLGNIGRNQLYQALHTGAIPSIVVGRKVLIPTAPFLACWRGVPR